ncbi:MAG: circadian clock protein KaiC [Pirellulaceae bacterium]
MKRKSVVDGPGLGVTLEKCPTGIVGLDEITDGGLPQGRPTLICGGAGAGKTLLSMEFLVRGAIEYGDPGVFMSFEETADELTRNVRSLGFDLERLVADNKLRLDFVRVERSEIEETGEYDLEGLFVRLGYAIDSIGAKRVALDSIETLFAALSSHAVLRAELRRLFRWLKDKGVTAVISGERGRDDGGLTRHGIEEYVSDCVIVLDHRVESQLSTRRLRVVKYRGSAHGTNEYPFIINRRGISVLPVTSLGLDHTVSSERVSTGIERLDMMFGGRGLYRGSTVVVSGTAGTGKSSLAAHFVDAACRRGEKCLYFAFEESPNQIMRNMQSIGLNLNPHVEANRLRFQASRPTVHGMESHLVTIHDALDEFQPAIVVLDPVTNLLAAGTQSDVYTMLLRLIDFLKDAGITTFITTLISGRHSVEQSETNISSLIDTWILLRDIESNGERNHGLYVAKSRGMAHSNQIREYRLTDHGFEILDAYLGTGGALTGSARLAQEANERAERRRREHELQRKRTQLVAEQKALEAQIAALQSQLCDTAQEMGIALSQEDLCRTQNETLPSPLVGSQQAALSPPDDDECPAAGAKENVS